MGKVIINVYSSVQRVIEDKYIPNAVKTGLIKGLAGGGDDIVDNILSDVANNLGKKVEKMYRYAKDHYPYGLPKANFVHQSMWQNSVTSVCGSIAGFPVTLDYSFMGPRNLIHYGWQVLFDSHGYVPITNVLEGLSSSMGTTVYLEDMIAVIPEALFPELSEFARGVYGQAPCAGMTPVRVVPPDYNPPATPHELSSSAVEPFLRVSYIWRTGPNTVGRGTFSIPIPTPNDGHDYFQVKYSYVGERSIENPETHIVTVVPENKKGFFSYQDGSGVYSELDDASSAGVANIGEFFPYIYFRLDRQPQDQNPTSAVYKASKKMMNIIGMNFQDTVDSIHQSPDIADVEQALLTFAVPYDTINQLELRYLYDFFIRVHTYAGQNGLSSWIPPRVPQNSEGFFFQFRPPISFQIGDPAFDMTLEMNAISRKRRFGTIGSIGFCQSMAGQDMIETAVQDETGERILIEGGPKYRLFRRQIAVGIYDEVRVDELAMNYNVFEGRFAMPKPLMIPLDHAITRLYKPRKREALYARSMYYVFNTKKEHKVKWYETGLFKFIMMVIAIIITVVCWGADGGAAIGAAASAAAASMEGFLMAILIVGLEIYAVRLAMKLVVKLIGPEAALILSMVLAAVAAYGAFNAGSITGAPWAKDLLTLSSNLITGVNDNIAESLLGIQKESEAFGLEVIEKNKELETAKNLLEGNNLLSPFVIFGEKPTDYFNRTVHSGNIGMNTISAISSYVDIALTLPRLPQTFGGGTDD